ncbi:sugar phosphate isomerase/epimerase family protein [Robertmurraya massiliosenegalensis]|uniref:sugar phosphate isomerase/epimerase family protein n=1 Tax=Robertmurraya TaxID=2837507 RepID=UPI0039A49828
MKLGLGSYALAWAIGVPGYPLPQRQLDAVGFLRTAHKLGVKLVQFADNVPLEQLEERELFKIKEVARELEIEIEIGTRGTSPNHLRRFLELARFFDAKLVRTIINSDNMMQVEKDIHEVLPLYETSGVTLGIENHDRHTTEQFSQLFNQIGSRYVGVCLDTVNSFGALEGPNQVIKNLAPFIVNVHVKDFEIKRVDHMMGFLLTGTPAGEGMLDIDLLLNELKEEKKDVNIILELWPPFANSIEETVELENEWAVKSIRFLKKKILKEIG